MLELVFLQAMLLTLKPLLRVYDTVVTPAADGRRKTKLKLNIKPKIKPMKPV